MMRAKLTAPTPMLSSGERTALWDAIPARASYSTGCRAPSCRQEGSGLRSWTAACRCQGQPQPRLPTPAQARHSRSRARLSHLALAQPISLDTPTCFGAITCGFSSVIGKSVCPNKAACRVSAPHLSPPPQRNRTFNSNWKEVMGESVPLVSINERMEQVRTSS